MSSETPAGGRAAFHRTVPIRLVSDYAFFLKHILLGAGLMKDYLNGKVKNSFGIKVGRKSFGLLACIEFCLYPVLAPSN